jgi:1-acyl-sn-glycerol-3-phosphate acyltransferase
MASPSIASATDRATIGWRAVVRLLAMVGVLIFLIVPHLLYRLVGRPSPMVMAFLNAIGWIAGLRVRTTGTRRRRDVLFASNHVSWLDILALGGAARSAFVAKAEVERVPLVGWLADQNNSVYVSREARQDVQNQAHTLRGELARGHPVTLFPEGTTGLGTSLLPFRASLFQAVSPPPPGVRIQPVLLDYGQNADAVAWIGTEHGIDNFKRILSRRGTIPLAIHYLDALPELETYDRKMIANAVRMAIATHMAKVGLG